MRFAADDALNTHAIHQPRDRAAGHIKTLTAKLPPNLPDAVDPPGLLKHTPDLEA